MNATAPLGLRHPRPPHLTMDEYVVWIQATIQQADPVKAARQKSIQEHITAPFRIGRNEERSSAPVKNGRES